MKCENSETGNRSWSWSWLAIFFPLCLYYWHGRDSTLLIWTERLRELRKHCPVEKRIQARPNTTSKKKHGPWMHKTQPLSPSPPNFKKFIQTCFSKKHDISISSEVDLRVTSRFVCLYIILKSLLLYSYLPTNLNEKHFTSKGGK